ncbi:MAG: hypothetical protein KDC74_04260 [Flavobacteriaceae bacterium]|nr:hypothetical protein [Flavobacteriaceae bacterium]
MKTRIIILLTLLFIALQACENNNDTLLVKVAKPKYMTLDELRSAVKVTSPVPIEQSAKIYTYKNLIFVNDLDKGIHVIDNTNPKNPQKIAFLEIPANKDMEVKGDYLYADSLMDLVVFDISDINDIKEVNRLKDVFPAYVPFIFEDDVFFDFSQQNYTTGEILVGWEIKNEWKTQAEIDALQRSVFSGGFLLAANAAEFDAQGQGGSLARFKIVSDYLYAVDSHSIHVFDISNLNAPNKITDVYAGFDIETIFNRGVYLFLGSMTGVFIYDIESPESPKYVSEFRHGTACDPVVVDDTYAYITLRAGNTCGATESSLQVVDISDIQNPELVKSYAMDGPYGLGILNNLLFVCDGSSGLKVYDKTDVENLIMLNDFKDITTHDVIPLEDHLLMIGDNMLYQYEYGEGGILLISKFSLQ